MPDVFMAADEQPRALSPAQIEQFIRDGFVKLERAFSRTLAEAARAILWRDLPCRADDPASWTRPVIRLGEYHDEPFARAVDSPPLRAAFDQLVRPGRWRPRRSLGTFPVRFPHPDDPGDAGWHVDVSFPGPGSSWDERTDFSDWRANVHSHGRALLMLFLFSDIGERDAPTRIKVGSHRDVARHLQPAGEAGLPARALGEFCASLQRPQALATGRAGDVYLCHPFLAHAAQMHRGMEPRFLAQPAAASNPAAPARSGRWRLFPGRGGDPARPAGRMTQHTGAGTSKSASPGVRMMPGLPAGALDPKQLEAKKGGSNVGSPMVRSSSEKASEEPGHDEPQNSLASRMDRSASRPPRQGKGVHQTARCAGG